MWHTNQIGQNSLFPIRFFQFAIPLERPPFFLQLFLMLAFSAFIPIEESAAAEEIFIDSSPFLIDRKLPHMRGASSEKIFQIEANPEEARLFWLTGARVTRSDPGEDAPDEYMCHAWVLQKKVLNFRSKDIVFKTFKGSPHHLGRLFTLSVNQPEVRFPPGFGIPYEGAEKLGFYFMVASANKPKKAFQRVLRGHLEFQQDDLETSHFKALFRRRVTSVVPVKKNVCHFGKPPKFDSGKKWRCVTGESLPFMHFKDDIGQEFAAHWWARPGHTENFTLSTEMLDLPFDTTIHFISVHIHPGVTKVILRDLTEGKDIFVSEAMIPTKSRYISTRTIPSTFRSNTNQHLHVSPPTKGYSSQDGIPVFRNHEYALITEVRNQLREKIDIMSTLHIYLHDRNFSRIK